jgi:hypothetical protein
MKSLGIVFLFLTLIIPKVSAQCADTFEIKSINKNSPDQKDGKITLLVRSSGKYTCELLSYVNAKRTTLETKTHTGTSEVVFDNLEGKRFYRIVVTFLDETDPLCHSRTIDQIALTGDKRKL